MTNKRAFVVGVNSFSGSSFAKYLLDKNYKVYGFGRSKFPKKHFRSFDKDTKNFKFFKKNINKDISFIITMLKKIKPKYFINYAAQSMVGQSWENPDDWLKTNSFSIPKLYNEVFKVQKKIKFVHISTPEVYGSTKLVLKENQNYQPSTPYAVSRVTADQYLDIMHRFRGLDYVSIRAANVYGEHQRLYRIIPKTIYSCIFGSKMNLHGGGKSLRSFIHIDDVSAATYLAMTKGKSGQIYHVSTNKMVSIKNLVKKICNFLDKNFKEIAIISKDRIGKDSAYRLSNFKIRKIGWRPKISLNYGLQRVIEHIKKNKKFFEKKDLNYIHKK